MNAFDVYEQLGKVETSHTRNSSMIRPIDGILSNRPSTTIGAYWEDGAEDNSGTNWNSFWPRNAVTPMPGTPDFAEFCMEGAL